MVRITAFFNTSLAGAATVVCAEISHAFASTANKQNVPNVEIRREGLGVIRHY